MREYNKKELLLSLDTQKPWEQAESDFYWFMTHFQKIIRKLRIKHWFCYGNHLTWRKVFGCTVFSTEQAEEVYRKCAPTSEAILEVHSTDDPKVLALTWYHHDAPTGETMYLMSKRKAKSLL